MLTVETSTGRVAGALDGDVARFRGIPYAAPPVGARRFRPPAPHPGWTGVREALTPGPVAPQPALEGGVAGHVAVRGEEDCLFLDVVTPGVDDGRRPVLVWIHGGGFTSMSGSEDDFDGASLARHEDVVVVTLNYRLGALGWLYLADHADPADGPEPVDNVGLLDQLAALRWVQANIGAFGGDPARVAVFGQSAGAMSIALLLVVPQAEGLFHAAIAESGAVEHAVTRERAATITDRVMTKVGARSVADLRSVPAEQLIEAQLAVNLQLRRQHSPLDDEPGRLLTFGPVRDGVLVPLDPLAAVRAGAGPQVPLLTGSNGNEWRWFTRTDPTHLSAAEIEARLAEQVADPHALVAHYRQQVADDELWDAMQTDRVFRLPAERMAEAHAAAGEPTYLYEFTWAPPESPFRAMHGLEVSFVFEHVRPRIGYGMHPPEALGEAMGGAWAAFARRGDPNHAALGVEWPPYDVRRCRIRFDDPRAIVGDHDVEARRLWGAVGGNPPGAPSGHAP